MGVGSATNVNRRNTTSSANTQEAAAAEKARQRPKTEPQSKPPEAVSAFEDPKKPSMVNLTGEKTSPAGGPREVNLDPSAPSGSKAYQLEKDLSSTRQRKGELMEQLEQARPRIGGSVVPSPKELILQRQLKETDQHLEKLTKDEANFQPASQIQQARYQVFQERLGELERTQGKKEAARIARQSYYNTKEFNAAALTLPLSETDKLKAGLPPEQVMMTPKGEVVDIGHVAAAMDWELNKRPGWPTNLQEVTLVGDLASSAQWMAKADKTPQEAADSGLSGLPDLKGDIDALNIANRLRKDPNASLTDTFKNYYSQVDPKSRMDEFATHSPYVKKDASGQLVVDKEKLADDMAAFGKRTDLKRYPKKVLEWLDPSNKDWTGDRKVDEKSRELARYFETNLLPQLTAPVQQPTA